MKKRFQSLAACFLALALLSALPVSAGAAEAESAPRDPAEAARFEKKDPADDDGEEGIVTFEDNKAQTFNADEAVTAEEDADLFDALGLDTTKHETQGYNHDTRAALAPYGEGLDYTINEAFTGWSTEISEDVAVWKSSLYGDQEDVGANALKNTPKKDSRLSSGGSDLTDVDDFGSAATAAGDFNGNGKKDGFAMIHLAFNGMMRVYAGDAKTGAVKLVGSANAWANTDVMLNPADAERYLNVATGDLDGDGYDEIVAIMPGASDSRVFVYSMNTPGPTGYTGGWTSKNLGTAFYPMGIKGMTEFQDPELSRHTFSLAVGDLNADGKDDIAIAASKIHLLLLNSAALTELTSMEMTAQIYYSTGSSFQGADAYTYKYFGSPVSHGSQPGYGADNNLFGTGENALMAQPNTFDNAWGDNYYFFTPGKPGVEIADVDGSGNKLLFGYTMIDMDHNGAIADIGYGMEVLAYNGDAGKMQRVPNKNGWPQLLCSFSSMRANAGGTLNVSGNTNVSPIRRPYDTYMRNESDLYTPTRVAAIKVSEAQDATAIMVGENRHNWNANVQGYEYRYPGAGNVASLYPYGTGSTVTTVHSILPGRMTTASGGTPALVNGYLIHYSSGANAFVEFITADSQISLSDAPRDDRLSLGKYDLSDPVFATLVDTDNDSMKVEYVDYNLMYTDPTVIAALAAPPFYQDVANYDDGYPGESTTEYTISLGTSAGSGVEKSVSTGVYVAVEYEAEFFSAKMVAEGEVSYNSGWETAVESTQELMEGTTFSAYGEDSIVLVSYPMDVYRYRLTYPTDNAGTKSAECDYTVTVPYPPANSLLTLDEYNEVYEQYEEYLPDVDGDVFTHEVGFPSTYPGTSFGYKDALVSSTANNLSTVGYVKNELSITETAGTTTSLTNSFSFSAGGGGGGGGVVVKAGVTGEQESSTSVMTTNTKGVNYATTLGGLPSGLSNKDDYFFQWKTMQYNYYGKQNFPVVTYVVTNERNPANLPEEYGVDNEQTTNSQVGLYWEPSRNDRNPGEYSNINYMVYRVSSGGRTPLPTSGVQYDSNTGHYTYIDAGRTAGTIYNYEIVCKPASRVTPWSVPTRPLIVGITNPASGKLYFSAQPQDTKIASGAAGNLSATFSADNAEFFWQRYSEIRGAWEDLTDGSKYSGANTSTLHISQFSPALAGRYRLGAAITLSGGNAKHFYSDSATVTYDKLDTTTNLALTPNSFDSASTVTAKATVAAGSKTPAGMVQFDLTRPSGAAHSQTVALVSGNAEATFDLPLDGVYTVEASYLGNVEYARSAASPLYRVKNIANVGNVLVSSFSQSVATYGDSTPITASVYSNANSNGASVTPNVTVKKYNAAGGSWEDQAGWWDGGSKTLTFKDVGSYRLIISSSGASNTITKEITVGQRPVTYTVKDAVATLPSETPSGADLKIELTGGSLAAGDNLGYDNSNLAAYNRSTNAEVPLNAQTPVGNYRVSPKTYSEDARYSVQVFDGTYVVATANQVDGVNLNKTALSMKKGESAQLTATVSPADAYNKSVVWESDTPKIVSVNANGLVTAKAAGKATVTVATANGKTASCAVTVTAPSTIKATGVTLNSKTKTLKKGDSFTLKATVQPTNATDKTVTWATSNSKVATVAKDGKVKGITTGKATITAASGGKKADCVVTVTQPVTGVKLNVAAKTLKKGKTFTFKATVRPNDASNKAVTWKSSKKAVAAVNSKTGKVTAKKNGTSKITATAKDGDKKATAILKVGGTAVKKVELNTMSKTIKKGKSFSLKAKVLPAKASFKDVTWSSSNSKVAKVSTKGQVTGKAKGKATITATTKDGNKKAACKVTVK